MEGLRKKGYAFTRKQKLDPGALVMSALALVGVLYGVSQTGDHSAFFDLRSVVIVFGGTFAAVLFQFDLSSFFVSLRLIGASMLGTPDRHVLRLMRQLDDAILNQLSLTDLREGAEINGELLNDVVYMHHQGMLIDEIEQMLASRTAHELTDRETALAILQRAAMIAPSLGLFGTVIGLVGVLRSLSDPSQIGPSMSLALMTTAYGAGLGSLIFTPLAGRLQHHNLLLIDSYQQFLKKVALLVKREDRQFADEKAMGQAS